MLKFVSKALLSVVMDKSAREKLEAARAAKARAQGNGEAAAKTPSGTPAKTPSETPAAPPPMGRESLAPAVAMAAKKGPRPMTPERQALIREALAVQRSQSHILDNLSDDAKAKLLIAAIKAFHIPPDEIEKSLRKEAARSSANGSPPVNGRRDRN